MSRRSVHFLVVPGVQMQCSRQAVVCGFRLTLSMPVKLINKGFAGIAAFCLKLSDCVIRCKIGVNGQKLIFFQTVKCQQIQENQVFQRNQKIKKE